MSMKTLEAAILAELRQVTGNEKLRQKDIMEWSTSPELAGHPGEKSIRLPGLGVTVCYRDQADPR